LAEQSLPMVALTRLIDAGKFEGAWARQNPGQSPASRNLPWREGAEATSTSAG
jgi:hypothetical protein